ncbi:LemA family protein [Spirulina subsalsa]|nr:LemA family protein [Spirulina subsalsa]
MSNSNEHIPEELADEVLEVASRLYQETQSRYSLSQLEEAGSEVSIPPEFIQKAIAQVEARQQQAAIAQQQKQQRNVTLTYGGIAVGVFVLLWGIFTYNGLAERQQQAEAAWAQVENQLQRRADLIPNLLAVTQAQAQQEQEIVRLLTQSREQYLQATSQQEKIAATTEMNRAIGQFNQWVISQPELGSSRAFIGLQDELAGTENRIATERLRYNQAIQQYNQFVRRFPNSILAGMGGFEAKPYFQAENTELPRIQ